MAVIPIKKIRLLAHQTEMSKVLEEVQKSSVVQFEEVSDSSGLDRSSKEVFEFNYVASRLDFAVAFLTHYEQRGKFESLLRGDKIPTSVSACKELMGSYYYNEVVEEVAELQEKINESKEKIKHLLSEKDLLKEWVGLDVSLGVSFSTAHTNTIFLKSTQTKKGEISPARRIEDRLLEEELLHEIYNAGEGKHALIFLKENEEKILSIIKDSNLSSVSLPKRRGAPREEITRIDRALVKALAEKDSLDSNAEKLSKENLSKLRILSDYISWKKGRYDLASNSFKKGEVAIFEGWCPEEAIGSLESAISARTTFFDIQVISPDEGESPPVEIRNNALIAPFESITRLYGLPGHKDLDPTAFLAGFFFLFFGLSLTDVGYGLFLVVVTALALHFFVLSSVTRLFLKLLLLGGVSSVLVGFLFGGYLGIDPANLPAFLQAVQKFDPIANPLPVFYLALGLGVFQVMFGMVLRIISDAKNGLLRDGIFDQGPWLLLFVALGVLGASMFGAIGGFVGENASTFVYVALAILIIAKGRKGKTIVQKALGGLLGLYDSIGYFSDILSYSRLLALGLATSALAFAVNLIAELIGGMIPVIGPAVAVLILIVGHLFNLAVNTLGAFIHSARLQFVEFFGKFISGTGRNFTPFKREERYVTIVE